MSVSESSHFFTRPKLIFYDKEGIGTGASVSIDRPVLVAAVKLSFCYSAGAACQLKFLGEEEAGERENISSF